MDGLRGNQGWESRGVGRLELEVIQLVVQGYENRDIARELLVSEETVKRNISNIFSKLCVSDRLELALYVIANRLVPLNSHEQNLVLV